MKSTQVLRLEHLVLHCWLCRRRSNFWSTGLGADEISDVASTWLAAKNNDLVDCLKKLELVDNAYQKLLTDEARKLLDSAGCEDVEITWGSDPVEPVEAIMQTAGLRK